SSGPTAGGTDVVISGYNFSGGAGLTQVSFGDTPAASFQILSDTQVLATSPAHGAGVVDVRVRSGYGTSAVVGGDQFTFVDQGAPGARGGSAPGVLPTDLPAAWFTAAPGAPAAAFTAPRPAGAVTSAVADAGAATLRPADPHPGAQP